MDDNLILNKELNNKIKYYLNLDIPLSTIKSKEAVLVYFVYESPIIEMNKITLDLFIQTHLKYNDKTLIYIFTNQKIKIPNNAQNRVNIILIDYLDHKIMENRIIFIYTMMQLFNKFDKLYFFDSDVIPLDFYSNLFDFEFDIGLSFHPLYEEEAKYPVNGGFLIINYKNMHNIKKFIKIYLNSYIQILENEIAIRKNYKMKKPLSIWYGDQLLFLLLNIKFPKLKKDFYKVDIDAQKFTVRLFNEFRYNNNVYELKKAYQAQEKGIQNENFNFQKYLQLLKQKEVHFIHLKGKRRIFATDLATELL